MFLLRADFAVYIPTLPRFGQLTFADGYYVVRSLIFDPLHIHIPLCVSTVFNIYNSPTS